MKLSYSAVWEDTLRLARSHATVIAALAGVFLFLPALLVGYFFPQPTPQDMSRFWALMAEYMEAHWHWVLIEGLINMAGSLAILLLLFGRGGATVGAAIGAGFALLPFYFAASVLTSFALGIALFLLIIPGIYLFGRLAPLGPVMAAENRRNPLDAMGRTFQLTRGNGWAIAGLVLLVGISAGIVMMVVNVILGILFTIILGEDLGNLLRLIVTTATGAAFAVLLLLLYASIYRRLTADSAAPAAQ